VQKTPHAGLAQSLFERLIPFVLGVKQVNKKNCFILLSFIYTLEIVGGPCRRSLQSGSSHHVKKKRAGLPQSLFERLVILGVKLFRLQVRYLHLMYYASTMLP